MIRKTRSTVLADVRIVLLVGVLAQVACFATPYDGQTLSSKETPVSFIGATLSPNQQVRIEAFDFSETRWETVGTTVSSTLPWNNLDLVLYTFFQGIELDDEYWLDGVVNPNGSRARMRLFHGNGSSGLYALPDDWLSCSGPYSTLGDAVDNCGAPETGHVEVFTPGYSPPNAWHLIRVARHNTASITTAAADEALHTASVVLQRDDGPGDFACPLSYFRSGAVTVFTVGDGSIDSQSELNQAFSVDADVKVVDEINFCNGIGMGIIGCAANGGTVLTVRHNQEGTTWAHEIGHTRGLDHRTGVNNLMHPDYTPTARRVNVDECFHFLP